MLPRKSVPPGRRARSGGRLRRRLVKRYAYDAECRRMGRLACSYDAMEIGFDRETNLNYNYFRDYDPSTGRYVQSDPIGLAGGSLSLYTYADNAPLMKTDPLGLATYQCTRRLNDVPFRFGPLFHQYVCTGNAKSGFSCKGLGPTGSMFNSPGQLEPDPYKPERCEKVQDDNQCIEDCIQGQFKNGQVPNYSVDLSHGENCQTYANATVSYCVAKCSVRKK